MKKLDLKLKKDILAFCFEDSADLLSIVCLVNEFFKSEIKQNTLEIVKFLLSEKLIKAGWVQKECSAESSV